MGTTATPKHSDSSTAPWHDVAETDLSPIEVQSVASENEITYLKGLKLHLIITAVCIAMFLATLEIPVVATSIVGITDDLGGFDRASWIVSAYLIGYAGFIIIFSKLSDIFGRRLLLATVVLTFVIFSGACGAAQTLTQLIVLRAFQGIGGGGCYAMGTIMVVDLVPEAQYAALVALISMVFSIAWVVGPIVGGAINNSTTWRWVFLINVPCAVPAILIIFFFIPKGFPYHGKSGPTPSFMSRFSKSNIARVDFLGGGTLVIATLAFVAALEEAGLSFGWRSALVITLLTVSGVLLIAFLLWERHVTRAGKAREPVFPFRWITNRAWLGMLLNAIFHGAGWACAIFQLPQRFQVVNGVSAIGAGVRLLPFTIAGPIGSITTAILVKKGIPPIYFVLFAAILEVVGFSLLGTVPFTHKVQARQYGFQILAGMGCGTSNSLIALMTPFSVEKQDKAVAMGTIAQFRIMGGAIGLSIVNTAMHGFIKSRIAAAVTPKELSAILDSVNAVAALSAQKKELVVSALAQGYNLQMKILAGLAGIQVLTTLLMWRRNNIRV